MDERPETGDEWMRLVNRRLTRLERRLRSNAATPGVNSTVFLIRAGELPGQWEEVPDLMDDAPDGWMYVHRAQKDRPGQES